MTSTGYWQATVSARRPYFVGITGLRSISLPFLIKTRTHLQHTAAGRTYDVDTRVRQNRIASQVKGSVGEQHG